MKYTILQEDSEHLMAAVTTAIVVIAPITTALGFNFIIYKIKGVDQKPSKIPLKSHALKWMYNDSCWVLHSHQGMSGGMDKVDGHWLF